MSRLTQDKGHFFFFATYTPRCDLTQDGDIQQSIQSMFSAFPLYQFSWEYLWKKKSYKSAEGGLQHSL